MIKKKMYCVIISILILNVTLLSQSWQSFYNGTGNGDDESRSVCADDSGNVYVTGFSLGLNSNLDIHTIKYSKEGGILWMNSYNGTGNSIDKAFGIVQDEYGFIYVGGYTTSTGGNEDFVLLRYNAAGTLSWSRTYNHSGSSSDQAWGIVVDIADRVNIYLTGSTRSGNNYDYLTVKFRDDGVLKWFKTYDRGQSSDDRAIGITTSTDGDVIVTGSSQGSNSSFDYYTIKYTSDGAVVWSKRYNGLNNGEDKAFGIVSDNLNNITVTGYSMRSAAVESRDVATIQYDKNGYVKWTNLYNGPENSTDDAFGIVVDDLDNIYIAGSVRNAYASNDFLALKYSQSGTEKWATVFNSGGSNSDNAYTLSTGSEGQNIYLAGSSIVSGNERISVVKLNSNGAVQQWILYPGSGCATSVKLNNENSLFLGGYYISSEPGSMAAGRDYVTMEFPDGLIVITALSENGEIPGDFALYQNYPNPFNPTTKIRFDLPEAAYVRLIVYNVTGEELSVLADSEMRPGSYEVSFGGRDLSSGLYFYKLFAGNSQFVRKMIIVK